MPLPFVPSDVVAPRRAGSFEMDFVRFGKAEADYWLPPRHTNSDGRVKIAELMASRLVVCLSSDIWLPESEFVPNNMVSLRTADAGRLPLAICRWG